MDNEKAQLAVEIDALQIQHRELGDAVAALIGEIHALTGNRDAIVSETASLKEAFVATGNQIAAEKLAWIQQKAAEMQELDAKKETVQAILDRERVIDALAASTDEKRAKAQDILNQANAIADATQREKVACQVMLDEAAGLKRQADEQNAETGKRIGKFKDSMRIFHDSLSASIGEM